MRLRHIEVFHAVYTAGSMTNAATLLHVSQPAISKVLAHAEQQLGYALFDRIKGRLIPTPEAHLLFSHVAKVYRNIDQLRTVSRNLHASEKGRIRVAATPAFGVDVLPGAIASYRLAHPKTRFEIETLHHDEILESLNLSRIDIGLTFNLEAAPNIAQQTLATAHFVALSSIDLAPESGSSVRIDELARFPFVSLNSKGPLGRQLVTHLETSGVEFDTVAVCETYHVAKALVAASDCVTIVDEITARSPGHDNIIVWPLHPALKFDITACHFENTPLSLVAQKFLTHLKRTVRNYLATPFTNPAATRVVDTSNYSHQL